MTTPSAFDYAIPFNIFVGFWSGIASLFTPKGEFEGSFAYTNAIYWETPYKLLHFRQDPLPSELREVLHLPDFTRKLLSQEFDLHIVGKTGTSGAGGDLTNIGVETTPDVSIFHVGNGEGSFWFNCQICGTANERKIIGPELDMDGNVTRGDLSDLHAHLLRCATPFQAISEIVRICGSQRFRHE